MNFRHKKGHLSDLVCITFFKDRQQNNVTESAEQATHSNAIAESRATAKPLNRGKVHEQ